APGSVRPARLFPEDQAEDASLARHPRRSGTSPPRSGQAAPAVPSPPQERGPPAGGAGRTAGHVPTADPTSADRQPATASAGPTAPACRRPTAVRPPPP